MSIVIDEAGVTIETVEQILADLNADQKDEIGAGWDTSEESPVGQVNGIYANALREVQEILPVLWECIDPAAVDDWMQDNLASLTGARRLRALASAADVLLTLTDGTTVPAGAVVSHSGDNTKRFVLRDKVTADAGDDDYAGILECEVNGPTVALANTLTVIETPVTGWTAVINAAAATVGRHRETDAALRIRREELLARQAGASVLAVYTDLIALDDMISVQVLENTTDNVVDGMPPHSIHAIVWDDGTISNDVIAQTIFDSRAAGIETYGAVSGDAIDPKGNTKSQNFTRCTIQSFYVIVRPIVDDTYAGDAAVKAAVAGLVFLPGQDVIYHKIAATVMAVAGVINIFELLIDIVDPPVLSTDIAIGTLRIANITVDDVIVIPEV